MDGPQTRLALTIQTASPGQLASGSPGRLAALHPAPAAPDGNMAAAF